MARLIFKHEDYESGRDIERGKIHSDTVSVQKVSLSHVLGGWKADLVRRGAEAVAEGVDDSAEDQTVDHEHLYPEPLLEGLLFFRLGCWHTGKVQPVLAQVG